MSGTREIPLPESATEGVRDSWEPSGSGTGDGCPFSSARDQTSSPTPRDVRRGVSFASDSHEGHLESNPERDLVNPGLPPARKITDSPVIEDSPTGTVVIEKPSVIGSLKSQLNKALIESQYDKTKSFLPRSAVESLVQQENIRNYWRAHTDKELHNRCTDVVDHVCGSKSSKCRSARLVFVVLLFIDEPALMLGLLKDKVYDEDLPLVRVNRQGTDFQLARRSNTKHPVRGFDEWKTAQRLAFENIQWQVTAPVFPELPKIPPSKELPVTHLNDQVVLPLTEYDVENRYQGNSEVVRVKIHPAHHRFNAEENQSFALKSLNSEAESEFQLERKALTKIRPKYHLVSALAAFKYQNKHHLLFRWADGGNLANLWSQEPVSNHETVCWLAEQCHGLADGLDGIHNARLSESEAVDLRKLSPPSSPVPNAPSGDAPSKDVDMPVAKGDDQHCGRHGDIKPQNILWFKQDKDRYAHGVLRISDFGLTTFHSALTTKVANNVPVTYTYAAPERDLDADLSRPFDIWSLGCVYLEFMTWYLLGPNSLGAFKERRKGKKDARTKFITDEFYSIYRNDDEEYATVKEPVTEWIKELKELPRCSKFFSSFLDYIQTKMLVVEKNQRDKCGQVKSQLRKMADECVRNPDYAFLSGPEHSPSGTNTGGSGLLAGARDTVYVQNEGDDKEEHTPMITWLRQRLRSLCS